MKVWYCKVQEERQGRKGSMVSRCALTAGAVLPPLLLPLFSCPTKKAGEELWKTRDGGQAQTKSSWAEALAATPGGGCAKNYLLAGPASATGPWAALILPVAPWARLCSGSASSCASVGRTAIAVHTQRAACSKWCADMGCAKPPPRISYLGFILTGSYNNTSMAFPQLLHISPLPSK